MSSPSRSPTMLCAASAPSSSLPVYLPNLQNLSLEGNELKWTKDLDTFASRRSKLANLKELLLTGNPVLHQ